MPVKRCHLPEVNQATGVYDRRNETCEPSGIDDLTHEANPTLLVVTAETRVRE